MFAVRRDATAGRSHVRHEGISLIFGFLHLNDSKAKSQIADFYDGAPPRVDFNILWPIISTESKWLR
jgi:hypothetical protein